jgi:hypothetical protein
MARPKPTGDLEVRIDDDVVAAFQRDGFASVDRLTTDEELEWIGEVFDEFFAERRAGIPGGYFDLARPYDAPGADLLPQVLFPEHAVPDLRRTVFHRNARTICSRLLGVPERDLRGWGHMIDKPAGLGAETPWHQDEAYWEPHLTYHAAGVWMPLDDVALANGCMCFLPGPHLGEVLPHRHIGDDPAVHGLRTDGIDGSAMVPVPLRAGGATIHHRRTLHHTPANGSDRPRRAFATEFQTEPIPREVPVDRPWVDEGRAAWAQRAPSNLR